MTEDRLLTTSYRTVGKSPETFGSYTTIRVESHAHREGGHTLRLLLSGFFQYSSRSASGSFIPSGMSLM